MLKEPVGANRHYTIDELAGDNEDTQVTGDISLIRTGSGILINGKLIAEINGTCSRCLGSARQKININMEDEYFPTLDIGSGVYSKPEPGDLTIDENHILDLSEALRQYIIMATPTKMLCKADCPGICSVCGQEFSKGDCQHKTRPVDSRWEKLVQLEKESKI
ncbi:MAG: DUF177 domain-containing protein [Dehalococcoidia bacterium]|nr:DUF177 domain-containing protein [Dehalococcoidia bacterium]MDD5493258.1 DUF177 domain-containing protein [Dehalococcoidia bacterium]